MPFILYEHSTSACVIKVRLTMLEKGFEGRFVDLRRGGQFDPAYLRPGAVVPTLAHDGNVLAESSVALSRRRPPFAAVDAGRTIGALPRARRFMKTIDDSPGLRRAYPRRFLPQGFPGSGRNRGADGPRSGSRAARSPTFRVDHGPLFALRRERRARFGFFPARNGRSARRRVFPAEAHTRSPTPPRPLTSIVSRCSAFAASGRPLVRESWIGTTAFAGAPVSRPAPRAALRRTTPTACGRWTRPAAARRFSSLDPRRPPGGRERKARGGLPPVSGTRALRPPRALRIPGAPAILG